MTEPKLRCWPGCTARLDAPGNPNHGIHVLVIERLDPFRELFLKKGEPSWFVQPLGPALVTALDQPDWHAHAGTAIVRDRVLTPVDPLAEPESTTTDQRIPEVA